jgi:hypothetical protein
LLLAVIAWRLYVIDSKRNAASALRS